MPAPEPPPRPSAPTPARVGRYDILAPVASGGMATVYLAQQRGLGGFHREVALKLTHAHLREQPNWATELLEEAKIAARIQHPNVVQVLDVDDDPLGVFLVMQYVEGDTLSGLVRHAALTSSQRMPREIGLRILDDALAGLHAAHELRDASGELVGLVHRDFSPQNVLVGVDGVARLTDFGVAKAADRAGFTRTGTIKGKFGYMSPEQVRDRPLDRRSDVWAAGVVAWELLAGRRLYPSGDQTSTLFRIVTEEPPLLRTVLPDVSPALEEAVASALTLDVAKRCPSAEDLRRRIEQAWGEVAPLAERTAVAAYVRAVRGPELAGFRRRVGEARAREGSAAPPAPAEPGGEPRTEASLVSESVETQRRSPRARGPWRAVGSVIGAIALTVLAFRAWSSARPRAPVAAATVVSAAAATPEESPAPAAEPPATPATTAATEAIAAPPVAVPVVDTLTIDANASIVRIRINGRAVTIPSPARELRVPVAPDAADGALQVEGVAADGRRAFTALGAGERRARLVFRDRSPAVPHASPPAAAASAPPGAADAPTAPKLHASPYE